MPKILGKSGESLADTYDIEGSIAGIDNLESKDVHLSHELGATFFSERLRTFIVQFDSGSIAQTLNFNIDQGGFRDAPNRIIGVSANETTAGRTAHLALMLQNPVTDRETPIWTFNDGIDNTEIISWSDDGGAVADRSFMVGKFVGPQILSRIGTASPVMPHLIMRGQTTSFGAGTNTVIMLVTVLRPTSGDPPPGEPKSHGLPLPSW